MDRDRVLADRLRAVRCGTPGVPAIRVVAWIAVSAALLAILHLLSRRAGWLGFRGSVVLCRVLVLVGVVASFLSILDPPDVFGRVWLIVFALTLARLASLACERPLTSHRADVDLLRRLLRSLAIGIVAPFDPYGTACWRIPARNDALAPAGLDGVPRSGRDDLRLLLTSHRPARLTSPRQISMACSARQARERRALASRIFTGRTLSVRTSATPTFTARSRPTPGSTHADLTHADLSCSDLRGSDLRRPPVRASSQSAVDSRATRWPDGFRPYRHGVREREAAADRLAVRIRSFTVPRPCAYRSVTPAAGRAVTLAPMPAPPVGLCDSCRHQRVVRNTRGSSFSLCERSREDDRYPRYPRLPVVSCPGHQLRNEDGAT